MKPKIVYSRFRENKSSGFTLVELLIIIVIIGILVAIIVAAYNGIQSRAHDAAVKNDLRGYAGKLQTYYAENGMYPPSAVMTSLQLKATKDSYKKASGWNTLLFCVDPAGPGARFVIAAVSKSENMYTYSSQNGLQQYSGTWTSSASPLSNALGIPYTPPVWCAWAFSDSGGWNPNIIVN